MTTRDLAINPETGDIYIDENMGLGIVDSLDSIEQKLRTRLRFIGNEWFLDTSAGVPYYQEILVKNPNVPDIESILKAKILETEGVNELLSFNSDFNAKLRKLSVSFKVTSDYGMIDFSDTIF